MPDKKKRYALTAPPGGRTKHGLYSWVNSKKLPRGRTFQVVRRELSHLREDLVQEHGGEKIAPDSRILVDSVIEGLGVQKILGLYVREYGVIDGEAAKRGRLELMPILARNWIAYANCVRQGILALKEIDKGNQAAGPDVLTYIAAFDAQKEAQDAKEGPVEAKGERSQVDEGQAQGQGSEAGEEGKP